MQKYSVFIFPRELKFILLFSSYFFSFFSFLPFNDFSFFFSSFAVNLPFIVWLHPCVLVSLYPLLLFFMIHSTVIYFSSEFSGIIFFSIASHTLFFFPAITSLVHILAQYSLSFHQYLHYWRRRWSRVEIKSVYVYPTAAPLLPPLPLPPSPSPLSLVRPSLSWS